MEVLRQISNPSRTVRFILANVRFGVRRWAGCNRVRTSEPGHWCINRMIRDENPHHVAVRHKRQRQQQRHERSPGDLLRKISICTLVVSRPEQRHRHRPQANHHQATTPPRWSRSRVAPLPSGVSGPVFVFYPLWRSVAPSFAGALATKQSFTIRGAIVASLRSQLTVIRSASSRCLSVSLNHAVADRDSVETATSDSAAVTTSTDGLAEVIAAGAGVRTGLQHCDRVLEQPR